MRILAIAVAGICAFGPAVRADERKIVAQLILHEDGSRTEHVRNPEARTLEAFTRDYSGVLVKREVFRLGPNGQPLQCQVFDGRGNLIFRALYSYDKMGRKQEERSFNRNGRMVRRVVYRYDANGRALQPIAQNIPDPTDPTAGRQIVAPLAPQLTREGLVAQPPPPGR